MKMAQLRNNERLWSLGFPVAVALSVLFNIVLIISQLYLFRRESSYTYVGDDHPRELPINVRTVNMKFHDDPEHYALSGQKASVEWNHIRPEGKGFAFLGDAYFPFGVSMWHQLHCLNHIRTILINGDDGSDHTEHCFHYLRQGILCAADTTLEPGGTAMIHDDGEVRAVSRPVTHTCRDWKQVYDWMAEEAKKWTPDMKARFHEPSNATNGGMGIHHHMRRWY